MVVGGHRDSKNSGRNKLGMEEWKPYLSGAYEESHQRCQARSVGSQGWALIGDTYIWICIQAPAGPHSDFTTAIIQAIH